MLIDPNGTFSITGPDECMVCGERHHLDYYCDGCGAECCDECVVDLDDSAEDDGKIFSHVYEDPGPHLCLKCQEVGTPPTFFTGTILDRNETTRGAFLPILPDVAGEPRKRGEGD